MQISGLFELLRSSSIFSILEDSILKEVEDDFILKSYSHGDIIISEKNFESGYYLIFSGNVHIVEDKSTTTRKISTLKKGESFGEQSIMTEIVQIGTYGANSDVIIAFLPKSSFTNLCLLQDGYTHFLKSFSANSALQTFLKNFGSFGSLSSQETSKWLSQLTFEETMEDGELIFNEGDEGDKFYIVATGSVNISKIIDNKDVVLVNLTEGKFFGEMAIMSNAPRAATAKCSGVTNLISLNKEKFTELLKLNPILSTKINNIIDMYKASEMPKDTFVKRDKKDDYHIEAKDFKELKNKELPFIFDQATTPITAAISSINIIASINNKDFNKKAIFELIQSDDLKDVADILNDCVGIKSNTIDISKNEIKRIKTPFIIKYNNSVSVVYKKKGNKYKLASPIDGLMEIKSSELLENIGNEVIIIESSIPKELDKQKLTFMSFLGILVPYKKILIEIFLSSIFITLLSLLPPVFVRILIDDVVVNKNEDMLWVIVVSLIIIAVFAGMLMSLRAYLQYYLEGKLQVAILGKFYRYLISLPIGFFMNKHSMDILSYFDDGKDAEKFFAKSTMTILIDGTTVFALLLAMLIANSELFLVFISFIIFFGSMIFLYIYLRIKYIPKTWLSETKTEREMLDSIKNIKVLKTFNKETFSRNNWEKMYINKMTNNNKYVMLNTIADSSILAMRTLVLAVLLGYGASMALANEITIGEALAINMIAMLTLAPLGKLVKLYYEISRGISNASGLNNVYSIEQEWNHKEQLKNNLIIKNTNIEFKNVDFSYKNAKKKTISNFSLFIPAEKYTAIVGPVGSGKSSIINLITRMEETQNGEIFISNQNISQVNIKSLRSNIGVVYQEAHIMRGTIKENIQYGNHDANLSQIIEATTLVGAHDFIINMPGGYDTLLGENGFGLSGGQKRLISIARALVSNPSILIMDEPTNDFDIEFEQIFLNNLKVIALNRTLIIITHRAALIRNADQISLIDNGEVVESGTHSELISNKGYYFYLLSKQLNIA